MDQLMELFLKNGLKPFQLDAEFEEIEKKITHSELMALLLLDLYGKQSMSDLAHHLGAPLSTLTSIIQRLQKRGYILKQKDERDRRIYLVQITDEGKTIVQLGKDKMNELMDRVTQALSAEELQQFIMLGLKVSKAIQDGPIHSKETNQSSTIRKIQIED